MTFKEFKELYKKFHRAFVLMVMGYYIGVLIAIFLHLHYVKLFGILIGFLFSIHRYREGFCRVFEEEFDKWK